jgi:UDP-4-amino-4,6-dideoxy-N-acetyl-beta-L-altrosamine transaminase
MNKFIPYAHQSIDSSDIESISKAMSGDMLTRGPKVEEFEKTVASYCGAQYAVAFNSGTSALFAACYAGEVGQFDRILTSPNTFIATVSCAVHFRASPIFIDIDRNTGNLDLNQLKINLEYKTTRGRNVILPVHFSGIPVDMLKIDQMINDPNTLIIEDAAHAIGSTYGDGQKVGSCAFSDMTIFSFHPAKTMTTGEGGMVTTNHPKYYERLLHYRNNGILKNPNHPEPWYYEVQDITGNFNFTEMQAALGLSQFKRLDSFIVKRRELMARYREKLKDHPHVRFFTGDFDAQTAYHLCVVQIDFEACNTNRAALMQKLQECGIGTQVHYIPLYRHPLFAKRSGDISPFFPQMEAYYASALSLPLYFDLTLDDVDHVVKMLTEALTSSLDARA